jgi:predicted nucleic acid-binding protein
MIDALRPQFQSLRVRLKAEESAICGVAIAELLQGVRSVEERDEMIETLSVLIRLRVPESIWEDVGDLLAKLRAAGKKVKFADTIQAALAVEYGIPLWTKDAHFQLIQSVEPRLKLFVP